MSAVPLDRVVAIRAILRDGTGQLGTGYLVADDLVLTAAHCTLDKRSWDRQKRWWEPAVSLRVARASDGETTDVDMAQVVRDDSLDVAVIRLARGWVSGLRSTMFARVHRTETGMLSDCEGIGFPQFQRDQEGHRDTAEFHGIIYQTDEAQSGRLLMREPNIMPSQTMTTAGMAGDDAALDPSPWGGLSGALTFYRGQAIGVVVEHHPRQGQNALRIIGFERISAENLIIKQILDLPDVSVLPLVGAEPVAPRPHHVLASSPPASLHIPGTLAAKLTGHTGRRSQGAVHALAFSPDGRLLASGGLDKTVRLWNPETGELIRTLTGHLLWVSAVAFSDDGRLLASASGDKTVRLWNPETGELIRTLTGHTLAVNAVVFSRDGRLMASASNDETVRLWDPQTGELIRTLSGVGARMNAAAFSPDGQFVAGGGGGFRIVDGPAWLMPEWRDVSAWAIRLWDPQTGELMYRLAGHVRDISTLAFSPDGWLLASGGKGGQLVLWKTWTRQDVVARDFAQFRAVNAVAFSPNGRLLASADSGNTISIWT